MSSDLTDREDRKKQNLNHSIKNQHGKHIYKREHLEAILSMLHNGKDGIEIDGHKVTVQRDFRKHDSRETVLFIEGI